VALTAGKNCSALKDPEKHRPAIDNNTIAVIMIFTVLSIIKRNILICLSIIYSFFDDIACEDYSIYDTYRIPAIISKVEVLSFPCFFLALSPIVVTVMYSCCRYNLQG
jgi:hypothetical protein